MAQSGKGKEADNMQAYALTDVGKSRSVNQDYVYSSTSPLGSLDNLFLVADGMGGHNAGDYASRYTVENLVSFLSVKNPGKDIQSLLPAHLLPGIFINTANIFHIRKHCPAYHHVCSLLSLSAEYTI